MGGLVSFFLSEHRSLTGLDVARSMIVWIGSACSRRTLALRSGVAGRCLTDLRLTRVDVVDGLVGFVLFVWFCGFVSFEIMNGAW